MGVMTMSAPPGWYTDPSNPAVEHWWDGTAYMPDPPTSDARRTTAGSRPAPPGRP